MHSQSALRTVRSWQINWAVLGTLDNTIIAASSITSLSELLHIHVLQEDQSFIFDSNFSIKLSLANLLEETVFAIATVHPDAAFSQIATHFMNCAPPPGRGGEGSIIINWRCLIEKAHRLRVVTVTYCTTTLSAGVNLPARRVVIRSIYSGQIKISWSFHKQISVRPGRAGFDTEGDAVLMTRTKLETFEVRRDIANGGAENVWSGMLMGNEPIKSSKLSRSQINTPSSTLNLKKQHVPTLEVQVEKKREGDEEQSLNAEENKWDELHDAIFANQDDDKGRRRFREEGTQSELT
ncbi:hypothetical protein BLNAU_4670 [Blattamonas nauphoetae]|uniref:Uncharacterized protein n=1 Tax=Blattamonas nauphoetae TaxID=2049346 RepID=A0ABQ9Y9L4_9EUKA|nr:hypothetical protein BLNAU_4670 [Blattamonas nauphoetae]